MLNAFFFLKAFVHRALNSVIPRSLSAAGPCLVYSLLESTWERFHLSASHSLTPPPPTPTPPPTPHPPPPTPTPPPTPPPPTPPKNKKTNKKTEFLLWYRYVWDWYPQVIIVWDGVYNETRDQYLLPSVANIFGEPKRSFKFQQNFSLKGLVISIRLKNWWVIKVIWNEKKWFRLVCLCDT